MQNYAQIGDSDHYSLHNKFIISVITLCSNPSTYKLLVLVFKSCCKTGTLHARMVQWDIQIYHLFLN